MLYLFATLFITATLGRGHRGKGDGRRGGGKGSGPTSCTVTVEEQNNNLDTFLAPFTSESSDDSTTCRMRMFSSSWPHVEAVGATRRLLDGSHTKVDFDVRGKVVSTLQVTVDGTADCLTTTSFTVSSVAFNYAGEVEESMAEEVVAEDSEDSDSKDCDKDSDSEETTEEPTEEEVTEDATEEEATEDVANDEATEETTEGDATEGDDDLINLRRNLADSEESNTANAVLTLTQTNPDGVSFDLTVQCGVRYRTDEEGACTPVELDCKKGDYSYNVEGEGADPETVESNFTLECATDDESAICAAQ